MRREGLTSRRLAAALPAKIENVMLAAPDVDFDVFQRQIKEIGAVSSRFFVFVSRDDEALAVSRRVWSDKSRLGGVNPESAPYRQDLQDENIRWLDLTGVTSDDPLRHGTFAQSPEIVRMIGERLAGGQVLSNANAGVGDKLAQAASGAAAVVGSAAGVAVAAPFAIVDPPTRENLGDNIEQAGTNFGDALDAGASAFKGQR